MIWWLWIGLAALLAALLLQRFVRVGILAWTVVIWLTCLLLLRFGFATPIPASVFKIYMLMATGALALYVSADAERLRSFSRPVAAFLTERRFTVPLAIVAVAVPAAAAFSIYRGMTQPPVAPNFGRSTHPAPPESIQVHGTDYDLIVLDNPYRQLETSDPEAFARHLERGREVYYANCFYCHGDLMRGAGMFAHGLNPIPTNFQDTGTIPQLQESFLFWRIATGGPGLPAESGPWDSAMPAWEKFLTEDEIWDVIQFLYDFTGTRPRARQEELH
jgi:mono/diheme cytochrome c family protein